MIFPGVIGQQQLLAMGGGGGSLWTPLNLAIVPQIYLDAHDSVVTDVSGACSAISNLGAMGVNGDFSQGTAANRPTILAAELNGTRVLRFDGGNDVLLGNSTQQKDILRNVGKAWSFQVVKKRTADASGVADRIVLDCRNGTTSVRFGTLLGRSVPGEQNQPRIQAMRLDGSTPGTLNSAAISTDYVMLLFYVDYALGQTAIYENGELSATGSMPNAGSTSNTTSTAAIAIGAFNTGVVAADIDLASILIDRAALSAGDIDRLFGWAAHKKGLTANLLGGHPYKTTPPYA